MKIYITEEDQVVSQVSEEPVHGSVALWVPDDMAKRWIAALELFKTVQEEIEDKYL